MIKFINYIALLIITLILAISCTNDSEMQNYFVKHQDDTNFLAIDLPASLLGIDTKDVSDEVKDAVNSFKKVNVLALKKNDNNNDKCTRHVFSKHKVFHSFIYCIVVIKLTSLV